MGLFGIGSKKKDAAPAAPMSNSADLPPPPPTGTAPVEAQLPSFEAEKGSQHDVALPEIPDLPEENSPKVPEFPDFPAMEEPKLEAPIRPKPVVARPQPAPKQEHHDSAAEAYKHTPAAPKPKALFGNHESSAPKPEHHFDIAEEEKVAYSGDHNSVYLRAEDYRELIEGIDGLLRYHNSKSKTVKKEFTETEAADEHDYQRFSAKAEDIQRSLLVVDRMLFD